MRRAIVLVLCPLVALGEDIRTLNVQNLTLGGQEYQWYRETVERESSLQGYWRLGETSGNFADSSAAGNTATVSGVTHNAPSLTASQATNGAARFDGTDDKAVLASSSLFNYERTQSFSVEFLIKPNFSRTGANERIPVFSKLESSGNTRGFEISVEYQPGEGRAFVRGTVSNNISSNRSESCNSTLDLVNGQIYHVVVTYDGTSHPLSFDYWINGIQEGERQIAGNVNATILSSVAPSIGGRSDNGLFGPGTIDEVSVYNTVLTPTQILNHYSAALLGSYAQLRSPSKPKIIFDTDMNSDCDDVGALAIVNALQKLGECALIACGVSVSAADPVNAVDAINTWYGRGDVPIGRFAGNPTIEETSNSWTTYLKNNLPNDIGDGSLVPSATEIYRQALADAADGSVVIIQVGFASNTYELLSSSADRISAMTGEELIKTKVARLVVMGGRYQRTGQSPEYNFQSDKTRANYVVANWPTPIFFIGAENGDQTLSGNTLDDNTPSNNPVRVAYAQYGSSNGRQSWDPITALYAVRGSAPLNSPLMREIPGTNSVSASDGTNTWIPSVTGAHRRICQEKTTDQLETILNNLIDAAP
jgi:inosine-uridine nucleoside N-ribohydrolase